MHAGDEPSWLIREDASRPVLIALYLRQALGIRWPDELPQLREARAAERPDDAAQQKLERQWRAYWEMTVEPQAHPSPIPLDLVDGFATYVALPSEGADELRAAFEPLAPGAMEYAERAHYRYSTEAAGHKGSAYRGYAAAIAEHERRAGRRAHPFELNVQVLPLTQRGVWWIGSLTIAVTDGLRDDVVAFDTAIRPIIADVA